MCQPNEVILFAPIRNYHEGLPRVDSGLSARIGCGQMRTAGYIVSEVERLRGPMQQITDFLVAAANIRKQTKVVALCRTPTLV